tara:strand:- start:5826 stop:6050 length:225 start_codon:yes stop_codon:yes gene_type:complete
MSKYSPNHYQRGIIEVWDFIEDQNLDYFLGNVVKYVCRAGFKPSEDVLEDLKKAKTYLSKKISIIEKQDDTYAL